MNFFFSPVAFTSLCNEIYSKPTSRLTLDIWQPRVLICLYHIFSETKWGFIEKKNQDLGNKFLNVETYTFFGYKGLRNRKKKPRYEAQKHKWSESFHFSLSFHQCKEDPEENSLNQTVTKKQREREREKKGSDLERDRRERLRLH